MLDGERMRDLRKNRGLTMKTVAEGIGISYNVYHAYESGKRNAGLPVVEKLADFYGVSTDYILGRKDSGGNSGMTDEALVRLVGSFPADIRDIFCDAVYRLSEALKKMKSEEESETNVEKITIAARRNGNYEGSMKMPENNQNDNIENVSDI